MLKTIDLFAGAGGLSLGFEMTGKFKIVAAAEKNKYARETYLINHQNDTPFMIEDVSKCNFNELACKIGGIDIVIGGPPCQGFSNANRQKNHIISENNSLVKEFFRAVKEIMPKAFVMENVSMLSSKTHRFYDSRKDHEEIVGLGIPMRQDELVIADENYDGLNCLEILSRNDQHFRIDDKMFQLLNVLYKDRNNNERLGKFLYKNGKRLKTLIEEFLSNGGDDFGVLKSILFKPFNTADMKEQMEKLGAFIRFQKGFRLIDELKENKIIYTLYQNEETGKIIASVRSYAVIDYVKKVLGELYFTKAGVLNSIWFGVPQERKRFIMMGIRPDLCGHELDFPEADRYDDTQPITVGEAISDLTTYSTVDDLNDLKTIPYYGGEVLTEYETNMRKGSKGISNHLIPKTRELAQKRFSALSKGENFHKLSTELKKNYTNPERTQNTIYQRLDFNKPSGTVTNIRKSMWIHPSIDRALSVREAARLQSFPDRFIFKGTKDSQYQQVGNAVPPLMAKGIAECLLKNIK